MYNSSEDQQEQQDIERQNSFENWFYGNEIRGDATAAVHYLAENIGKLSSMENLMDAFHYVEPKKSTTTYSIIEDYEDDLPF
jgi:hypothetical protein